MIWGRAFVLKQAERGILRDDDHVRASVVVKVANGEPSSHARNSPGRARSIGDVNESPGAIVQKKLGGHRIGEQGPHVGDMAVGLRHVLVAVVVCIQRGKAEAKH